ncbi:hypothetical protein DNTS_014826 [Danionella cerebrum]|uniref:Uncharacterized protein n=1 Tax=Danionella cerebrum TaxID=2873325 RepID=A0A553N5C3_9TELE|nr:hypothetical protein DNTS_014826 [Danionella translucida]
MDDVLWQDRGTASGMEQGSEGLQWHDYVPMNPEYHVDLGFRQGESQPPSPVPPPTHTHTRAHTHTRVHMASTVHTQMLFGMRNYPGNPCFISPVLHLHTTSNRNNQQLRVVGGSYGERERERERESKSGGDISSKSPEAIPSLHQQCTLDVSVFSSLVPGLALQDHNQQQQMRERERESDRASAEKPSVGSRGEFEKERGTEKEGNGSSCDPMITGQLSKPLLPLRGEMDACELRDEERAGSPDSELHDEEPLLLSADTDSEEKMYEHHVLVVH